MKKPEKKRLRKTSKSYLKTEIPLFSKNKSYKEENFSSFSSTIENDMIICNQNSKNINNPPKISKKIKKEFFQLKIRRKNSHQNFSVSENSFRQNRLYSETTNLIKENDSSEIYQKNFKTEICKNFEFKGNCQFGDICCFAHGIDELRDKLNDNFFYKTKFCEKFFEPNYCPYGYRCQYLHRVIYNKIFFNDYFNKLKENFVDKGKNVFNHNNDRSNSDFFVVNRLKIFKTISKF